uniref:Uncharacterized protein n=1 Tax=Strongyloides papillosus TaxID=174720 RepID=A0A0N5CBT1_STREA
MLLYFKYLFIYLILYINFISCYKYSGILEGSGENEDSEEVNLSELISYDQGLPIAKFPILARSSSKSGLIPLSKGTTGELTGFTNGLTDEMKKLLKEDKSGMKFSKRKNKQISSTSVHNVVVDSEENKKNNFLNLKKNTDSNEEDLYNNLPEEKGQFLVEKMPFYIGAIKRNNGMKSLNAFGAYGKSHILKPFSRGNSGYGSSLGDKEYKLKPGQYFAGQRPPIIPSQSSDNRQQNIQQNVVKKGVNFRTAITSNPPQNPVVSKNLVQTLLTATNAATQTYNRLKVTNPGQNIKSDKTYLSPSLAKIGVTTALHSIKNSNHSANRMIQKNLQQHDRIPSTNSRTVVHGIYMTQFKKFPKPLEENTERFLNKQNNENDGHINNIFVTPPKESIDLSQKTFSHQYPVQNTFDEKSIDKSLSSGISYGPQFSNIVYQQQLPDTESSNLLVQQNPSQVETNKYLPIYSDNHQNNLKIEDFNHELLNKNINTQYINNDVEVSCCDGDLVYSTNSCCEMEPKILDNEYYQNDGVNKNFIDKSNVHYYNTFKKVNENSEEYGDISNSMKNRHTFKSYKPTSKTRPIFTEMEQLSPLPERIGDIYSNNFGNPNA